jgi:hypothetical protein
VVRGGGGAATVRRIGKDKIKHAVSIFTASYKCVYGLRILGRAVCVNCFNVIYRRLDNDHTTRTVGSVGR